MAEKNYKTVAVVPEMPRTIDNQQLHIYTPVGSTGNFGVFKPDGDQFVIVNGVLRADVTKLIQLADPPAIVTENGVVVSGSDVGVDIAFTEPDNKLNRKFQFIFKNIKGETGATGATGAKGDTGDNALVYSGSYTETYAGDVMDEPIHLDIAKFSRTPVKGDTFVLVYYTTETEQTTISLFSIYNVYDTYAEAQPVSGTQYVITGPKGEQGIQGEPGTPGKDGDDGVSITSVTQTGVQGGTQVTITLSNGQSTSFVVYNGINTNFQVVNTLPTENISTSTIYLVPSTTPGAENIYDEYIYVNGNWEHIGSTTVDLSDYVTKTYFNQNVGDSTKSYVATQVAKVHNLYIEMYESGSVPVVGQALTLTNANFAREPVANQYFGLLEVVNTKDKYYSICQILSVDTTTCSAKVVAVTEVTNGTEIDSIKASIAELNTDLAGKADTSALGDKLDKVKIITDNPQVYAKNADGTQGMKEIKGGNGIIVDAASDDKFLEVKVGDTIELAQNQSLTIESADNVGNPMVKISPAIIDIDPENADSVTIKCGGSTASEIFNRTYGPNIKRTMDAFCDNSDVGLTIAGLNTYYEISGVPTSSTSGTLPDNQSWNILQMQPQDFRLLFNKEFYQFADNQHTTGILVYSHVTYEGGQLIIKTITITIDTRGWVLTTIKSADEAYHIDLADSDSGSTLSVEQYNALLADKNSYILLENGPIFKLTRALTSADDAMQYTNVTGNITRYISITAAGVWTFGSYAIETTSNKTTTLSASSTNTQYPSAAAAYTYGQTVLNDAKSYTDTAIANAITTALNTPV